jgi:hypothetical protein
MRVLSSPKVLASAEQIGQKIANIYLEPNKTFVELREMINKNTIDILGDFGEACREEFRSLRMNLNRWVIAAPTSGRRRNALLQVRVPVNECNQMQANGLRWLSGVALGRPHSMRAGAWWRRRRFRKADTSDG